MIVKSRLFSSSLIILVNIYMMLWVFLLVCLFAADNGRGMANWIFIALLLLLIRRVVQYGGLYFRKFDSTSFTITE